MEENKNEKFSFKELIPLTLSFVAMALIVTFVVAIISNGVDKMLEHENALDKIKIELVAEELELKPIEVVKDTDETDTYYTNNGVYKVNFDHSSDDIKLRSIVKVKVSK
jgi:hypothetical protein